MREIEYIPNDNIIPFKSDKTIEDYSHQFVLGIIEASRYFQIGQHTLRKMVKQDTARRFSFFVGNRAKIKRLAFEQYLNTCTAV